MLNRNEIDPTLRLKLYIHQLVDDNIRLQIEALKSKGIIASEAERESIRMSEWANIQGVVGELRRIYGHPKVAVEKPKLSLVDRNEITDDELSKVKHLRLAGHSVPYIAEKVGKEENVIKECVRSKC